MHHHPVNLVEFCAGYCGIGIGLKSVVRNLIRTCNSITGEALAEEDDAEVILDNAEQKIFEIAESRLRPQQQSFAIIGS